MRASSFLSFSSFLVLALFLTRVVTATVYEHKVSIVGSDFFEEFDWESGNDPTHGRVNYLTQGQARAKHLAYGS